MLRDLQCGFAPILIILFISLTGLTSIFILRNTFYGGNQPTSDKSLQLNKPKISSPSDSSAKTSDKTPVPSGVKTGNSPNPTSSNNPTSNSNPSSQSNVPVNFGIDVSPSNGIDVSIAAGNSKEVLSIKSTSSNSFSLIGYPVPYGLGVNWIPASGWVSSNGTKISIQVNSDATPGTYTGTGVLRNDSNKDFSFPVKVTVLPFAPQPTPTPNLTVTNNCSIKLTYPTGGQSFKVGDKVKITWTSSGNLDNATIGYSSYLYNTLNWISFNGPNSGSYDWTVDIGNTTSTQFNITLDGARYGVAPTGCQVHDKSGVITITK